MGHAYVATPAPEPEVPVPGEDIPPGWDPDWPFPGASPPGYATHYSLTLTAPETVAVGSSLTPSAILKDRILYRTRQPASTATIRWTATINDEPVAVMFDEGEQYEEFVGSPYAQLDDFWGAEPALLFELTAGHIGETLELTASSLVDGQQIEEAVELEIVESVRMVGSVTCDIFTGSEWQYDAPATGGTVTAYKGDGSATVVGHTTVSGTGQYVLQLPKRSLYRYVFEREGSETVGEGDLEVPLVDPESVPPGMTMEQYLDAIGEMMFTYNEAAGAWELVNENVKLSPMCIVEISCAWSRGELTIPSSGWYSISANASVRCIWTGESSWYSLNRTYSVNTQDGVITEGPTEGADFSDDATSTSSYATLSGGYLWLSSITPEDVVRVQAVVGDTWAEYVSMSQQATVTARIGGVARGPYSVSLTDESVGGDWLTIDFGNGNVIVNN